MSVIKNCKAKRNHYTIKMYKVEPQQIPPEGKAATKKTYIA